MSKTLSAYLPQDRRKALARGTPLPDHTQGSALLADISGFTPLTEQLTETLGERRGGEEFTRRINAAFEAGQKMTLEEAVKCALEEDQSNG